MIGTVAGSYRIASKIAEGGMGVVYRAEHTMIGRLVAVKVLLPELSNQKEIVQRFFNEARAATAVRHPGIVEIFDFGYMPSGQAYIVMELLQGEPVATRLRRVGRMSEAEALSVLKATSTALGAAHAHGIVHRDLKPDNLFLCPDPEVPGGERPKLLDFGIAKLSGSQHEKGPSLTRTGAVLGTPTYMSPEQCRGAGEVDGRSDLYSLGCILFELVTGRPPFTSQAPGVLIAHHLMEKPESPRSLVPELSEGCDALIMRLLAKKPEERYATAAELHAAIEALQGGPRITGWTPVQMPGAFEEVATKVARPPTWLTPPPMPSVHGAVSPPTTLGASAAEATPQQNRRGLFIGVGALLAVGAVVALVLVASGGGSAKTADPTTNPDPTTDPTTAPHATARPTTDPSLAPDPTPKPTTDPTPAPKPTTDPTTKPATDPTVSVDLTVKPTTDPTTKPTTDPTVKPVTDPTVKPTTKPTGPTTKPTVKPKPVDDPFAPKPTKPKPKPTTTPKPTGPIDTGVMEPQF